MLILFPIDLLKQQPNNQSFNQRPTEENQLVATE